MFCHWTKMLRYSHCPGSCFCSCFYNTWITRLSHVTAPPGAVHSSYQRRKMFLEVGTSCCKVAQIMYKDISKNFIEQDVRYCSTDYLLSCQMPAAALTATEMHTDGNIFKWSLTSELSSRDSLCSDMLKGAHSGQDSSVSAAEVFGS